MRPSGWVIDVRHNGTPYPVVNEVFETEELALAALPPKSEDDLRWGYEPRFTVSFLDWTGMADRRLAFGLWKAPVWLELGDFDPIDGHFAHVSETNNQLVAFFEDAKKGAAGRVTAMKPGRYLRRFYPNLTPQEVEYWQAWFEKGQKPEADLGLTIKFAKTSDEIYRVYRDGPDSCMKGNNGVRAYGGGDLAIAYAEVDGTPIARAVCWPEKKAFGSVYSKGGRNLPYSPDEDEVTEYMERQLLKMGWSSVYDRSSAFNGARLRMQRTSLGSRYILMPYFDHGSAAWDHERRCIIVTDTYESGVNLGFGGTSGYLHLDMKRCSGCRRQSPETTFKDIFTTTGKIKRRCPSCAHEKGYKCRGSGNWYENLVPFIVRDDQRYSVAYAERNWKQCVLTGDWDTRYEMTAIYPGDRYVRANRLPDPALRYNSWLGYYYLASEESQTFPGWPAACDDRTDISLSDRARHRPSTQVEAA